MSASFDVSEPTTTMPFAAAGYASLLTATGGAITFSSEACPRALTRVWLSVHATRQTKNIEPRF
jgi:hypothetical protein